MKIIYAYKYGKITTSYDYIIIEKKGFDKPKIVQHGSCLQSFFKRKIEAISENIYIYKRRKDYSETVKILKTLVDTEFQCKEVK